MQEQHTAKGQIMAEAKAPVDLKEMAEDGATFFAWSYLHGSEYRDLAISRTRTGENACKRVQQAIEGERERAYRQAQSQLAAEPHQTTQPKDSTMQAETAESQPVETSTAEPSTPSPIQHHGLTQGSSALSTDQELHQPQRAPMQEDAALPERRSWAPAEDPGRPAWLAPHQSIMAAHSVPQAAAHTLQGARDRLTSRWFALKGVFEGIAASPDPLPTVTVSRAPVLAVFSLAGGVGKTSVVATLGRALSVHGERVVLVETTAYGLLPFFFGARERRPGVLRTFSPPETCGGAQVQMVTVDSDALGLESTSQDLLSMEIAECTHDSSRIIVDIATASAATARRVLHMSPLILVPVVPDMNSVVSTGSIDEFFQRNGEALGKPAEIYYVLNQFDPSLPLHLDMREVLREQLGDRLLPFALHSAPAVSEALAEGMTVMDYAPGSPVAKDFNNLAEWLKSISAPATTSCGGLRWTER